MTRDYPTTERRRRPVDLRPMEARSTRGQGDARRSVVTGGAGFIGSHLVERLLGEGFDVVVIDDLSTGRLENLASVADDPRLQVHIADVSVSGALADVIRPSDTVFHLAALADIVPSIERPLDYLRANVEGTVAVAEAARVAGVRRFVYAASSSCYGIPDEYPTPESAPARPQYPYALSKWLGEQVVLHWAQVYRLPAISLRLFNVYGPRARTSGSYGAVFGVFLAQKLAGKPLTVVGDGSQTRDFTYVTDVVDAFVRAGAGSATGVMNIGTGVAESVQRIVELLEPATGVVHVPKRPGEPDCTLADNALAREWLGWAPRTSLAEGVARLLLHIEDWREAPVWDEASVAEATRAWFECIR